MIAEVPAGYRKPIEITMNERDLDVVARNIIMLLIALVAEDGQLGQAIDCIIHVWYSALLRDSDMDLLQNQIRPLIESVCAKVRVRGPTTWLEKTWTFERGSLRVVLQKSSWDRLLSFLDIPTGLTAERAREIRTETTLSKSRRDFLEVHLYFQAPSHRIALTRFREDGLLLPFGSPRHEFRHLNPWVAERNTQAREPF